MDLSNWFKGFELGIARLTEEERKRFFAECGKNCVRNGVLPIYEKLYKDANGNMDTFLPQSKRTAWSQRKGSERRTDIPSFLSGMHMRTAHRGVCPHTPAV